MRYDLFQIHAAWGPRQENAEACARRLARMLNDVSDVHRGFAQMVVDPDWRRSRPADALPRGPAEIVPFLSPVRYYDEARKRIVVGSYNLDASAHLAGSRFLVMAVVAGRHNENARHSLLGNRVSVLFRILEGGKDEDATALAAVKPIMLAVISAWEPESASAVSTRHWDLWRAPAGTKPFVHGTWAAYFAPGAAQLSLTSLGVTRRLPDGGLLWCATDEALDLDNPVHLGAAAAMHAALARK
jgi:hypothetical protein